MMFLLRTAFWATVALALVPSFAPKQASTVPVVDAGAVNAMSAASATFADLSGLCLRRPDACTAGTQAVTAFGQRIRAGTTILYELVSDRFGKTERTAVRSSGSAANAGAAGASNEVAKSSQHTLTAGDMSPTWQGPHPRKDPPAKRSS